MTFSLDDLPEPIVLAPLAGGPSTPALAAYSLGREASASELSHGWRQALDEASRRATREVRRQS
jgi:hypothetical protein